MQLSDEEREHIRLTEEYRAEVRAKLSPRDEDGLFDKLAVPVIILIATALVSGLLVPWILGRVEDERRAFDLQSRLIEKIVSDDATAQVNLWQYRAHVYAYRISLLNLELEKRLLALQPLDTSERQIRREELREALAHVRTAYGDADAATAEAIHKYSIERYKNEEWVILHYGRPPVLESYTAAAKQIHADAIREVEAYQQKLTQTLKAAEAQLPACADEATCRAIVDRARADGQKLHDQAPGYSPWNTARSNLVKFISETKPRI